ncbi:nucleotidyltransferase family protein [Candidatus Pacearchaeota archaeon]|nr:nucleotidyltransferase family protein [Candidatus Pacearchaeota archaeon]
MAQETLNSEKIIKKIEAKGKDIRKYTVKKLGLFGSYAKNKQHMQSDVDILVEFEKPTFDNYTDLLLFLENTLKKKVDLVIEKDLHPTLKYVKKEARYVKL